MIINNLKINCIRCAGLLLNFFTAKTKKKQNCSAKMPSIIPEFVHNLNLPQGIPFYRILSRIALKEKWPQSTGHSEGTVYHCRKSLLYDYIGLAYPASLFMQSPIRSSCFANKYLIASYFLRDSVHLNFNGAVH